MQERMADASEPLLDNLPEPEPAAQTDDGEQQIRLTDSPTPEEDCYSNEEARIIETLENAENDEFQTQISFGATFPIIRIEESKTL
jgi:hypothetical protein